MPIFSRFGADFFTVYADFSRFIRDINGEKKNISLSMSFFTVSFSRFAPSRPSPRRNCRNGKPELLQPFHTQTATEPNWGHPVFADNKNFSILIFFSFHFWISLLLPFARKSLLLEHCPYLFPGEFRKPAEYCFESTVSEEGTQ